MGLESLGSRDEILRKLSVAQLREHEKQLKKKLEIINQLIKND